MKMIQTMSMLVVAAMALGSCDSPEIPIPEENIANPQPEQQNPDKESSYPAIKETKIDMEQYGTVIIATPLWHARMASNTQALLFQYGKQMSGKIIGLIVSSHSSGISGVESDAKRLVPDGKFTKSLWINASNHSNRAALIKNWLTEIAL